MTVPSDNSHQRSSSPLALAGQVVCLAAVITLGVLAVQGYGPIMLDLAVWGAEEAYYGILRQVSAVENLLAKSN